MQWSANCGTLYNDLPLVERFGAAAASGFSYAEMWSPFPDEKTLISPIVASGVQLVGFLFEPGDMLAGDRGILNVAGREDECLKLFSRAVRFAVATGARHITALVGNTVADREAELSRAADTLRRACATTEPAGLTIVVEALNSFDTPNYALHDAEEAAEFVRSIDRPGVRLLLDIYHVAREGGDPVVTIRRVADVLAHVHFADWPGRGAPGTGELDFEAIVLTLTESGYHGFVGIEYLTGGATDASLRWLPRHLRAAPVERAFRAPTTRARTT